jgi:hypothetical protein
MLEKMVLLTPGYSPVRLATSIPSAVERHKNYLIELVLGQKKFMTGHKKKLKHILNLKAKNVIKSFILSIIIIR